MEFKLEKCKSSGNKGKGVRSDCFITMELSNSDGIEIEINSKVNALYGDSIRELALKILNHYSVTNAKVMIEDSGAIDCVIAARMEAVIKLLIDTDKTFLTDFSK